MGEHVQDLLDIFKNERADDVPSVLHNGRRNKLIDQILDVLKDKNAAIVNIVDCLHWLFSLKENQQIVAFIYQLVPDLLWVQYLSSLQHDREVCSSSETLLVAMHNKLLESKLGPSTYCIPNIAVSSIYHESSPLLESIAPPKDSFKTPDTTSSKIDRILSSNRFAVMSKLWKAYNSRLSCYSKASLESCCATIVRLCSCGYSTVDLKASFPAIDFPFISKFARVRIPSELIREMVASVHFIMYNGLEGIAVEALKCLHKKATHAVCPESLMATSSLLHIVDLYQTEESNFELMSPLNPKDFKFREPQSLDQSRRSVPNKIPKENSFPTIALLLPKPRGILTTKFDKKAADDSENVENNGASKNTEAEILDEKNTDRTPLIFDNLSEKSENSLSFKNILCSPTNDYKPVKTNDSFKEETQM